MSAADGGTGKFHDVDTECKLVSSCLACALMLLIIVSSLLPASTVCWRAGDPGPGAPGLEQRAQAAEAAAEEAEGSLSDLLVCLGQEEHKVEVLSARLQAAGIDVEEVLLATQEQNSDDLI